MVRAPDGPLGSGLLAGSAAVVLVAASYANVLRGGFIADDRSLVFGAAARRASLPECFFQPFPVGWGAYYRPLTTLSYALQVRWFGPEPFPFHAFNTAAHLGCVTLLFLVSRRFGASVARACAAAAIWGVFPRLTESVSWISGRTDVLATLGVLGAFFFAAAGTFRGRIAAAGCLAAGLLSKEVAVAALPALAVLEFRLAKGGARERLVAAARRLVPATAVTAAFFVARAAILPGPPFRDGLGALRRFTLALQTVGTFASMVFRPLEPTTFIGHRSVPSLGLEILGAGCIALAVLAAVRGARRWPPATSATAALAAAGLLLVVHLVPLPVTNVASDRFLYLPLAGLAVALATGLPPLRSVPFRRAAAPAVVTIALVFAVATVRRNRVWTDEVTFWTAALDPAPLDPRFAWTETAAVLFREGRFAEATALEQALLAGPGAGLAPTERRKREILIAIGLAEAGSEAKAVDVLTRLIAEDPRSASLHTNAAVVELRRLDFGAARNQLAAAAAIDPGSESVRELLGRVDRVERGLRDLSGSGARIPARRARILEEAGTRLALRAWADVAAAADTEPEDRRTALSFLIEHGWAAGARRVLEEPRFRGDALPGREDLERALERSEARSARLDGLVARLGLATIN